MTHLDTDELLTVVGFIRNEEKRRRAVGYYNYARLILHAVILSLLFVFFIDNPLRIAIIFLFTVILLGFANLPARKALFRAFDRYNQQNGVEAVDNTIVLTSNGATRSILIDDLPGQLESRIRSGAMTIPQSDLDTVNALVARENPRRFLRIGSYYDFWH